MARTDVQRLEDLLASNAGALPEMGADDRFHFHDEMYPGLLLQYEAAKVDVARLGLTELVETAIRECITLLERGERKAAEDLLMNASAVLSEKSGTWDAMRRMYTAANDPDGAADQRSR